ncbi:MAG: HEAT repeat domain-containing protein [Myxococcales bacterium]|nr:HEAT repeat domain-containing protein [Myxococcales bacterium]
MEWLIDGVRALARNPVYDLTLQIVFVQIGIVIITLSAAFSYRLMARASERRKDRIRRGTDAILSEYLNGDGVIESALEIADRISTSDMLWLLREKFRTCRGRSMERLAQLYVALGFDAKDVRLSRSWVWWNRAAAYRRLGLLRSDIMERIGDKALRDKNPFVRIEAARALARSGSTRGMDVIAPLIASPNRWHAILMAEIAESSGPAGYARLRRFVDDEERPEVRATAIEAIALSKDAQALPILRRLLRSPEKELRVRAVKALGAIGVPALLKDLAALAQDPEWEVRAQAARTLGALSNDSQTLAVLRSALKDRNWWVRYNAARALSQIGEEGIEILREESQNSADNFARDMSRQTVEQNRISGFLALGVSQG